MASALFDADPFGTASGNDPKTGFGPIFTATYESECASCSDDIEPGDLARADDDGGWIHADAECERIARGHVPAHQNPCPSCFTVHAGECL